MNKKSNDFTACECKKYRIKVGHTIASSLSGFIAGFVVASIGWVAIIYMLRPFCSN